MSTTTKAAEASVKPAGDEKTGADGDAAAYDKDAAGENSSYEEVRASVMATDNEEMQASTFRTWVIGVIMTLVLASLDQFFTLHNPPLTVSPYMMVIISYPFGCVLARALPTKRLSIFGWSFSLNPGPFNYKEHALISIMIIGSSGFNNGSTATDVYTAFTEYLGMASKVTPGYKLMFLLANQALAIGLGGIFQRLVVDPAYCVWPRSLPTCAMIHAFSNGSFASYSVPGWKMSRMRFFLVFTLGVALYEVIPTYIFTALATFAWVTWIAPMNVPVNQVFGTTTGLALIPITFDWNQVTGYLGNPLIVPSWAILNIGIASVFFLWIITPALHWSNVWYGQYFPVSSPSIFDNTGSAYNTSRVVTSDFQLDEAAYHEYSPIFLSTTSVLSYGLGLGSTISVIVHTYLNHRKEIWEGLCKTFGKSRAVDDSEDIHTKLMAKYPRTPTWWYGVVLAVMIGISIAFVEVFDTGLPWWGIILATVIQLILLVPNTLMMAICNQSISLNVLGALIGGFIWPHKMEAVVVFKLFLYVPISTAGILLSNQKVGHYMKIPPRDVFWVQLAGIIVAWLAQTGVNSWALGNINGVCTPSSAFSCPIAKSFRSSTIFWGLIGPQKLFSSGAMYNSMMWFFLIGAALPIVVFFAAKRWPNSFLKHVHVPLIMSSTYAIPPATAINYMSWTMLGLWFNWFVKRRWIGWWLKYNYILSAALDAGLGICVFLVFFCLQYPGVNFNWWGNVAAFNTADVLGSPLKTVAPGKTFGPKTWL